jgi:hypothetical protein
MRVRIWMIVCAALAFLVVLLARLPASWITPLLPAGITCGAPGGSVWQGRCGQFSVAAKDAVLPVGPVHWTLRPGALLRARLAGTAQVSGPQLRGQASFEAGLGGRLQLRDLQATAPLDRRLLNMVPANWTGQLDLRFPHVALDGDRITALQGVLAARDIVAQGPRPDAFGSYSVEFAPSADAGVFRGTLRDLDGPVELGGTLDVRSDREFELNALIKARPSATAQLAGLLEYLGPADAQGRRAFSMAGDF